MASNQTELASSLIALASESMPSRTAEADGERKALAEGLESDREALERLDDDHYGGIIDRATWMRQPSARSSASVLVSTTTSSASPASLGS